jgi:hypothetical protein
MGALSMTSRLHAPGLGGRFDFGAAMVRRGLTRSKSPVFFGQQFFSFFITSSPVVVKCRGGLAGVFTLGVHFGSLTLLRLRRWGHRALPLRVLRFLV